MKRSALILLNAALSACGSGSGEGSLDDGTPTSDDADVRENDVVEAHDSGVTETRAEAEAPDDTAVATVATDSVDGEVAVEEADEGSQTDSVASVSCHTLVTPEPVVGVPPAGEVCAEAGPCDPDEVFVPYLEADFAGSGEPGLVGDGYAVGPDDRLLAAYQGGPAAGEPEVTIEAAFKIGPPATGCLIATDWRGYLAFSTSEVIALGYGTDGVDIQARFALNGFPPRAWDAYADGDWHHIAVTIDARAGRARFYLDGVTSPEIETSTTPVDGLVAATVIGIGVGCTGWTIDQVAIYGRALPAALVAEHAAAALAHEAYPNHSACGPIPCAPSSYDSHYVPEEYAPVDAEGRLTMDALAQLKAYPAPRYRAGHTLHRMESWVQPLWLSADQDLVTDHNRADSRAVLLMEELAANWHYYYDLSHMGCLGLDYPHCAEIAKTFLAAHPEVETVWQTYAAGADTSVALADERPACPLGLNPLWGAEAFRLTSAAWNGYWVGLSQAILGRPVDLIIEDGETWWEGRQWGGPPLSESDLATCAEVDPEVAEVYERDYVAKGLGVRHMWTDAFTRWRLGWNAALAEANGDPDTAILWYGMDGFSVWNAGDWGLGARLAEAQTVPQTFGGQPQRYSGMDFYPPYWGFDISAGPRHGIDWVAGARGGEIAAGDHLAWPFVAAGWSTEPQNIRPGMWLGILKLLAAWGAESYHPGYFAYPPHSPGGAWVWQAAIPAYAQAVTSRWEKLLRSSVLVEAGQRENPRHVVVVRQERDADGQPVARWLVTGNVNRWENTADTLYMKDAVVDVRLGAETLRVPIRMQGSVYVYDATGATPTLVQLDAWHEWTHPSWWSEDFAFEAEVDDGDRDLPVVTTWPPGEVRDGVLARTVRMLEPSAALSFRFAPRRAGAFVPWLAFASDGPAEIAVRVGATERIVTTAGAVDEAWFRADGEAVAFEGAVDGAASAILVVEVRRGTVRLDRLRLVRAGGPTFCAD